MKGLLHLILHVIQLASGKAALLYRSFRNLFARVLSPSEVSEHVINRSFIYRLQLNPVLKFYRDSSSRPYLRKLRQHYQVEDDETGNLRYKRFLPLLLAVVLSVFSASPILAQFIISYPTPAEPASVCLTPSLLTVRVDVINPGTNGTVTVDLPPGIFYVAGSVLKTSGTIATITESNISNLNVPVFSLASGGALGIGQFLTFTILREAPDCAARSFVIGGGVMKDAVTVSSTAGSITENDPNVNSYNLQYASISLGGAAPVSAVVGQILTRNVTITNGGLGALNNYTFTITEQVGGLNTTQLVTVPAGTVIAPASTSVAAGTRTITYNLTAAQMAEFGDSDGLFENGETMTLTRTYTVQSCATTSSYKAAWGCSGQVCQEPTLNQQTNISLGVPNARAVAFNTVRKPNFCTNGIYEVTIQNIATEAVPGAAAAFSLVQAFGADGGESIRFRSPLSATNFQLSDGAGGWISLTHTGPVGITPAAVAFSQLTTNPGAASGLIDRDGDGQYDDLLAGSQILIRYEVIVPCEPTCNSQNKSGGLTYQTTFADQCGTSTTGPKIAYPGSSFLDRTQAGDINGPTDINDGQTITLRFDGGKEFNLAGYECPTNQLALRLTVPKGYSLAGGRYYTNGVGNNTQNTISTSTIPGATSDVLVVVGSGTSYAAYSFEIDLTLDCALLGPGAMSYEVAYTCDNTGGCGCVQVWRCGPVPMQPHCPDCLTGGLTPTDAVFNRTTMGYANPLGATYAAGTYANPASLTAAQRKAALPFDTIQGYIPGIYHPLTSGTAVGQFYRQSYDLISGEKILLPQGLELRVRDNITNTFQTCTMAAPTSDVTAGGKHTMIYNLSSCGVPINPGDSVFVRPLYVVNDNAGFTTAAPVQIPGMKTEIYTTTTVPGEEFTCESYAGQLAVHRYTETRFDGTGTIVNNGCNTYSYTSVMGFTSLTYDVYPGEVRPGHYIDSIVVNVLSLDNFTGVYNLTSRGTTADGYTAGGGIVTNLAPFVTLSNGGKKATIVNDGSWPLGEIPGGNNTGYILGFNLINGCESVSGQQVQVTYYLKKNAYAHAAAVKTPITSLASRVVQNTMPSITLTNQTGTVQAVAPEHSWTVRMFNPTIYTAANTWLNIPTNPDISVVRVVDVATNTTLTPIAYAGGTWYQVSAAGLAGGTNRDYRIDFTYTNCNGASLAVNAGWDCAAFPTDPGTYPCTQATVSLPYTTLGSEVQLALDVQPAGAVTPCTPFHYELTLNSAQAANLIDVAFGMNLPTGLAMVPGSFEARYVNDGTGAWSPIANTGTVLSPLFDLTTHPNYPVLGIPGTVSSGAVPPRQIRVRFDVQNDCDFSPGSLIDFLVYANRPCGAPALGNGIKVTSNSISLDGVVLPYVSSLIGATIDPVEACGAPETVSVTTTIIGGSTSAGDNILVKFPLGTEYVSGSFSCSGPNCPTFSSYNATTRELTLNMLAGIPAGDAFMYSFGVQATGYANCGASQTLRISNTTSVAGYMCGLLTCGTITATTGVTDLNFSVDKPVFSVSNFDAAVNVPVTGSAYTYTTALDVTNTGTVALPSGSNVILEYFCLDAMGNITGAPVASALVSGPLAAGATTSVPATFSSNCSLVSGIGVVVQDVTDPAAPAPGTGNTEQCLCAETARLAASTEICYAIADAAPATQTLCFGSAPSNATFATQNNVTNGIRFVYFTGSAPADPYTGGTSLGTATGNGTNATLSAALLPTAAGVYYIYAIQNPVPADPACRPAGEMVLTINPLPVVTTVAGNICTGAVIDLTTLVTGNTPAGTLTFYTSQANADAGTNILLNTTVAPASTTTYYVRSQTPSNCHTVASITVNVNSAPDFTVIDGSVCSGGSIDLATLVTNTGGGTLTYHTTLADAQNGAGALSPTTVSPASATNYYVRSVNSSGCVTVKELSITILPTACGTIQITNNN